MSTPGPLAHDPLVLPRRPPTPPRATFPILAVLAPVVGAAVLFAVIGSPMMLAFAALSPVIAIASTIDSRISARRRSRADARAYEGDSIRFLAAVEAAHAAERARADTEHAMASVVIEDAGHRSRRWVAPSSGFAPLRIGTGRSVSGIVVSGSPESDRDRELLAAAHTLSDAPVLVDPAGGIGVLGVRPVADAFVRGLVVQLAHAHSPDSLAIDVPESDGYRWLSGFPHAAGSRDAPLKMRIADDASHAAPSRTGAGHNPRDALSATALIAVADSVEHLPAACRLVVHVDAAGGLRTLSGHDQTSALRAELITVQQASTFGRTLAETALTRGLKPSAPLPEHISFADLQRAASGGKARAAVPGPGATAADANGDAADAAASGMPAPLPSPAGLPAGVVSGLPAVFCVSETGPLTIDLVGSGPHAVVTGTTGSGKSELLIAWVCAMATAASPQAVHFLLVDFKGGTAFRRLAALPHTVGVVTDLGHGEALRALKSLRAELRRREAELARLGASDVRNTAGSVARLVIVVDEAAAMLGAFPDLLPLFVDIAARGRALGVHLVLGTQRATGVLSDALIANCALRISLRLASESDSTALLGTDAAARLPHGIPGRLIVSHDGELTTAQAVVVGPADVASVARVYRDAARPRAPWLPALPERIPLTAFGARPAGGIVLGARDDPDRQVQEGIVYRPQDAHLLVLGARGSGKSSVLGALAAQWDGELVIVPLETEGAWDVLDAVTSHIGTHGTDRGSDVPCLVLLDDVDALLERFDDDHRDAVVERIRTLLVDGPRVGIGVACTAIVLPGGLRGIANRFGERLVLRQADRQEHLLTGAPGEFFDPDAPPGRGVWRDRLCQIVAIGTPESRPTVPPPTLSFPPGSATVLVSNAPSATMSRLSVSVPEVELVDVSSGGAAVVGSSVGDVFASWPSRVVSGTAEGAGSAESGSATLGSAESGSATRIGASARGRSGPVTSGPAISGSAISGSAISDSAISDSAISDSAISDSAISDSAISDSATSDSAISDRVLVHSRPPATVFVGDPDTWQSQFSLLARLRRSATLVFDGCSLAQVRGILHSRVLPPVTAPGHLLVCDPHGEFSRARMP